MTTINWFPGHMHKARKDIAAVMPHMDVIIEVIDARIPFSSENPLVPDLRGSKPLIKLLNKDDLADPEVTALWVAHIEQESGVRALPVVGSNPDDIRRLARVCRSFFGDSRRDIRTMIMGIPNVGKSTIINTLAGRVIAKTGNEAGVTKAQQNIRLRNGILLTDTPGFLWPKLNPPSCGYRLAITGALKDSAYDYTDIGLYAAEYLLKSYPEGIMSRYNIDELPESDVELLEAIGARRGFKVKGGGINVPRAAALLITELRAGLLGPISHETPAMALKEEQQAKIDEAEKARLKKERDRMRKLRAKKNRR
ncbi:MAG: ribosome biogenesis GTPase YlqF [Myxococcales bacterium]|nr:ribosome biogenesis GTPase YlqF [Myxococcales bacterium]